KQVVWARKNCENRLSPSPAQGRTSGTKVREPPEPPEMSPSGPLSIWDKWDESARRVRNAGSTESENRLTAERGISGRAGQKYPNRPKRVKSVRIKVGQASQKYPNRPNRPKFSQKVQNQNGRLGRMDAKYAEDPADPRTIEKLPC
ncbi:hypothetical protein KI387_001937, partial [Taxus chinensis]